MQNTIEIKPAEIKVSPLKPVPKKRDSVFNPQTGKEEEEENVPEFLKVLN